MSWRSGQFDKARIPSVWHPFLPAHAAESLHQINLEHLWERGKRLILLDVDNTLVQWKSEEFAAPVIDWIEKAKKMGFEMCIISNTNRVDRLERLRTILGIETVRGRFKPSRAMFRLALIKFKRKPEEAIMVGDQIFTDVLGANRSGIEAIWVRKMEGKEFGGTSLISRNLERLLTSTFYRALIAPVDEKPASNSEEQALPVKERTVFRQLVRFCIVGGTSFIIDTGLTLLFMRVIRVDGVLISESIGQHFLTNYPALFGFAKDAAGASAPLLGGLASFIAMFNSFVWNRAWTFEIRGKQERLAQLRRFYTVSILGALLNTVIFSAFYNIIPARPNWSLAIAKVIAAAVVAVWNFTGQRFYAFRKREA